MKKLLALLILLTALSGCTKQETVIEETPTPEVTPEIKHTEGYSVFDRGVKEYYNAEGKFVHDHPLNLENFVADYSELNWSATPGDMCEVLKGDKEYPHYLDNNGEVLATIEQESYNAEELQVYFQAIERNMDSIKGVCPDTYEEVIEKYGD